MSYYVAVGADGNDGAPADPGPGTGPRGYRGCQQRPGRQGGIHGQVG